MTVLTDVMCSSLTPLKALLAREAGYIDWLSLSLGPSLAVRDGRNVFRVHCRDVWGGCVDTLPKAWAVVIEEW